MNFMYIYELAQLYFPDSTAAVAKRNFKRYLKDTPGLMDALQAAGYKVGNHQFSPLQVEIIYKYLGEP